MRNKLICKECNQEWKGFIHHIVFARCLNHLKIWKLFGDKG